MIFINKKPVSYLQIDPRWRGKPYATKGEYSTIGSAGCGPTSAAMIIATLKDRNVTPVETCAWALSKGYKALRQGTYYSYFVPQFKAFGLKCKRLNTSRILRNPKHPVHDKALNLLKNGHYLIALMGPGNWTRAGHFIVVWWADDKYYILDPNSVRPTKLRGEPSMFRNECRMYWAIEIPEEDEEMDQDRFNKFMDKYISNLKNQKPGEWSEEARGWAEDLGIVVGNDESDKQYKKPLTKEEGVSMLKRYDDAKERR